MGHNLYQTRAEAIYKMTVTIQFDELGHASRGFLMLFNLVNKTSFPVGVRERVLRRIWYDFDEISS